MKKDKIVIEDYPINSAVSVLTHDDLSHLEGKFLTLIDASYPDGIQGKSVKSLARAIFWDWAHKLPIHEKALIGPDLNRLGRVI